MATIADTLLQEANSKQCRFSKVLAELDKEDFTAVIIALSEGVSPNRIAKAIRRDGYKISHSTIQEHKEKHCMCRGEFQWV